MNWFITKWQRANELIALRATMFMSTMACVMGFLAWSLLPLFFPSMTAYVAYVSADIIQLVALPLIMVGQRLMAKSTAESHSILHERHDDIEQMLAGIALLLKDGGVELDLILTIVDSQKMLLSNQKIVSEKLRLIEALLASR